MMTDAELKEMAFWAAWKSFDLLCSWPADDHDGLALHIEKTRRYIALSAFNVRELIEDRYLREEGMLKRGKFLLNLFGLN